LRLCIRRFVLAYVGLFLHMGSCLRTWALTSVHEMSGRSSTLPIFTYFSSDSLLHAILTHLFEIFTFEYRYILFLSSFLYQNIIFSKFYLNQESNIIFLFCSHRPFMLVGEALIKWWSGTIFLSLKPVAISEKQALSLSLVFFWRILQALPWCGAY